MAAVRGAFEFVAPQTVEAKGKAGGVACRRLVRALSLMRPRGVSGFQSAFVGRDQELGGSQEAYRDVVGEAAPRLVTIVGEAGVGKTRLVRELWQWLAGQEPQPLQRTGRCLPYGQTTYWALGEVLKEHLGVREDDPPASIRARLGDREMLGLALGLDVAPDLHPLIARDRFQDAWVELLTELTAERPAAMLIEDLHWAEEPLLDLLEQILERVRGPLLVLTHRPAGVPRRPPGFRPSHRIDADARAAGGRRRAGADRPSCWGRPRPTPLLGALAQVEGNPFFLEEVLASLIDQGILERRNGRWTMSEFPDGFLLPDTVQAVVAARIDLLAPAEKEALQAASVIGRTFWSGPVYELCPDVDPDLRELEQRDFVRLRLDSSIEGEREYVIKHAVTSEVAYATIPKARRAHLHAAFADWVEQFAGSRDEYAPILAHHYARGDPRRGCRPRLGRQGRTARRAPAEGGRVAPTRRELALGRYEIDEAIALLQPGARARPPRPVQSAIWHEIGQRPRPQVRRRAVLGGDGDGDRPVRRPRRDRGHVQRSRARDGAARGHVAQRSRSGSDRRVDPARPRADARRRADPGEGADRAGTLGRDVRRRGRGKLDRRSDR